MAETPTTAVAKPLSDAFRVAIEERKAINEVARQIANQSWGKSLDGNTVRAVAEYARRYHIDPATELDILGGRIYRNANYFIRRGGDLLRRGIVTDISVQHVNHDTRLDALVSRNVAGAQDELDRRTLARIKHNIPDGAKGAAVVTITLASGAIVEGANYAGVDKDPVGTANPGKTAESRAYRRAWRLLVDTIPELSAEEGEIAEAGAAVATVIAETAAREVEQAAHQPGTRQLASGTYDEEPMPTLTKEQVQAALELDEVA
ncbi:MAG: hypothetical protein EKK62_17015 [Acidimicrobiia bacterium]|nr:MAG: hypothetical protein EKK62_17015 [Acidimicrobiia bacterium]